MKQGRVVYGGAVHACTPAPQGVRLADGRIVQETEVQWLAPFEPRTIFTLALNYADHAAELAAKSSKEQSTFLQAQLTGQRMLVSVFLVKALGGEW